MYNLKQQLENSLANQELKQEDYDDIANKVALYEESLLNKKKTEYEDNKKVLNSKLELINELIFNEEQGNY